MMRWVPLLLTGCANWRAPELCEEFLVAFCDNTASRCSPSMAADDCLDLVHDDFLPCADAIDVTATFKDCLEIVKTTDECLLDEIPDACNAAVIYRQIDVDSDL